MPGGRFLIKSKLYENPVKVAYTPYTVFIIQSRHLVKHGPGRVNSHEYLIGFCPAPQFKRYLSVLNSGYAGDTALAAMDNACWPWLTKGVTLKKTKWWEAGEDPKEIIKESVIGTEVADPTAANGIFESLQTSAVDDKPEEEYDSDDDDLAYDIALVEGAKQELKAKAKALKKAGASTASVLAVRALPFVPEQVLASLKGHIQKRKPLTDQQFEYVSDKPKLRDYSKYISHLPAPSYKKFIPKLSDPNLEDPAFIEGALAGTIYQLRKHYIPTLEKERFWIPLVAVTLPTRPLARVVSRLVKALPRGLPYYASMPVEDRKCKLSYPSRILNLRLIRMKSLTVQVAERLAGFFGGFPGIRFDPNLPGRGVNGILLQAPLTEEQRRITVLLSNSYPRVEEEISLYNSESRVKFAVGAMDELGNALDPSLDIAQDEEGDLEVEATEGDKGTTDGNDG
ncbi:hypothetical protein FRC17_000915, partial [Serendipita sp. 399]